MPKNIDLRTTFDSVAESYNARRPWYPKELFDALIKAANLLPSSNLLEIGPGTGQATRPLAEYGCNITAVDLSKNLAKIAKEELKDFSNVKIVVGAFEDVNLPTGSFDLVYSATAFHWIKPQVRFAKPYSLLKPKGHLALIHATHISDEHGDHFTMASQSIYEKYGAAAVRLPTLKQVTPWNVDEKLFEPRFFKVFPLAIEYTTAEYIGLMGTYSENLAMRAETRTKFFTELTQLINQIYQGRVTKHYGMSLTIARKKDLTVVTN